MASVLKVELIGTVLPSLPSAVPDTVYFVPGFSWGAEVHWDFSSLKVPATLSPSASFSVTSFSEPPEAATVTGLSGRTEAAPVAGTIWTFAAAGSFDGVLFPGVVDAPGVELLCPPPEAPGFASVSLQAVPTISIATTPATARPCFRTVLLNT